jgi:predicted ATP-dependent endonuclease of OLD family
MFLFDEPAANLHARAQTELLKSFDRIVENESSVIYSTHSAHMIEPRWVSAAHIVENRAIDYDSDNEELTFSSPPTCVTATPFRRFVASNPDRPTYFQPILDRLDYVSPLIAPLDPLLVTEGISDFHAISHIFRDRLKRFGISVLPGLGATEHDGQIATLVGRGLRFIIVLDDDEAGKSGADKYRSRWLLDGRNITTLGELAPVGRGKKLETILPDAVLTKIADHFESSNKPTKKQIGIYFAQANAGAIAGLAEAEVPEFSEVIGQAIERLVAQK